MADHLAPLNPEQRAAATAPAPVLVLAGAGSGKTETLTRRVAALIERGEAPERLLCITFTTKAAGEMRARLTALLGPERAPRWVGTFHAVMARLLLAEGGGIPGLPRGFAILPQGEARRLLARIAGAQDGKEAALLAEGVSLLKNGLATEPRRLPRSMALARFDPEALARAAALLPAYQAALAERQALDLDDLIATPVAAMRADPALAARCSGRWAEILVDEYQDTNHAQHALLRLLAGTAGRLFAVGDDLQAIYGWRGADVTHIRRFGRDYPAAPVPLKLETNYRSTPTILRAANAVARQDTEALQKTLRPADPQAGPGAAIAIREADTPEEEGRCAVAWAQALRRRQPDLPWRECAVLVRAGFVAEPILAALREAGIPARLMQEREPEMPREVLAAIAWLRLAMSREADGHVRSSGSRVERWDPAADDAFRRACAFPARGIGAALFGRLRAHAAECGLALAAAVATLPATPAERQGLEAVLGVAREIGEGIARGRLGPADALRLAAEASELGERLREGGTGRLDMAWEAALRAADQAGSVAAYCDAAALDEASGEVAADAVPVMTLHRAKGLEFDHVLLAGLEEGVWPHWQAEEHGTLAEERRLFYVGLTRARHSLCLSWARHRREWAGKPSRFLAEIPNVLVEGAGAAAPGFRRSAHPDVESRLKAMPPPTRAEADRLVAEFRARKAAEARR
ncbi:UvrD-helicase domain-containing protein [Roseomonas sp. NAR14]|uniref:DNA 3'-5' helicase n=1 Tax=Roseomonas acroporae TaxID=2937791 RepID=A0A9X2BZZ2_9PROT|nr:UvrD-helicase domain-containing protein [Roseomonas acroporae]MCK8787575.1 UvrD-helicase domain-containing protein [Roseomonas acroporae]